MKAHLMTHALENLPSLKVGLDQGDLNHSSYREIHFFWLTRQGMMWRFLNHGEPGSVNRTSGQKQRLERRPLADQRPDGLDQVEAFWLVLQQRPLEQVRHEDRTNARHEVWKKQDYRLNQFTLEIRNDTCVLPRMPEPQIYNSWRFV